MMKTYLTDIIPKFQRFIQKLDNETLLTTQHWVEVNENTELRNVYIFKSNNKLLISQNGKVKRALWEYLGNNSLLIENEDETFLYNIGFFDDLLLVLKIDGQNEYAFLYNETKLNKRLDSIENVFNFLERRYLYTAKTESKKLTSINDTNISDKIFNKTFQINNKTLTIHASSSSKHTPGDMVFIDNKKADDGIYKLNLYTSITVKNGEII